VGEQLTFKLPNGVTNGKVTPDGKMVGAKKVKVFEDDGESDGSSFSFGGMA
jgi:hypothetical protein